MACHHRPWTTNTIGLRQSSHAIMDCGQHGKLDDLGRGNAIISLGMHTRSDYVGCGMPSSPLKSIHYRTTSGVEYYPHTLTTHIIGGRWTWHVIIALGMNARSDDVSHGIPSSQLDSIHNVERRWACHAIISHGKHIPLDYVFHGMPSLIWDNTDSRTTLAIAYYDRPWSAHTVRRCQPLQ